MSRDKNEQPALAASASSMPSYLTEEEKKMNEDYEFCLHDLDVRRQYGDQVVAVHQRRIWGAGPNYSVALDAALQQPGCPPQKALVLVVVPPLLPVPSYPSSTRSEYASSTYSYLTEEEKKINDDYEWCLHDLEVRRQYGGMVVVAHQRRIWGAGSNHRSAWEAALQKPDCPHPRVCAFVVVPHLIPAPSNPSASET